MIVAAEVATFGVPEVKRGLFAAAGGVYRLPRVLPRNIALEMILTGDPITATRAHALGLVNRIVATAEDVLPAAFALARTIASNSPNALRVSLALARQAHDASDVVSRQRSDAAITSVMQHPDSREGALAFVEKRPAVWAVPRSSL